MNALRGLHTLCRMALIETALPPEALDDQWGKLSPDAALTLSFPGKEPLQAWASPVFPLCNPSGPGHSRGTCGCPWTRLLPPCSLAMTWLHPEHLVGASNHLEYNVACMHSKPLPHNGADM